MADNNATQAGTQSDSNGTNELDPKYDIQFESFKRLEPMIRALPQDKIVQMNIDATLAVTIALGAMPRVEEFRDAIAALGSAINTKLIAEVVPLGHAFAYANADYINLTTPTQSLATLHAEGTRLRERMVASQQVFEMHGLVQGQFLEGLKGAVGYRNLSHDLSALARFYRENWSVIGGKSPLTIDDVDRASVLAGRLLSGVASKEGTPAEIAESTLVRHQAFSLFARAYDETRRAISLLRWHEGDADEIAPSIYTARGGRKKSEPATDLPTQSAATAPVAAPDADEPDSVPVGHVGSSPFRA